MFGMSGTELIIIVVLALILIGPDDLPNAAKTVAKTLRDIRKAGDDLKDTFEREVMDDVRKTFEPPPGIIPQKRESLTAPPANPPAPAPAAAALPPSSLPTPAAAVAVAEAIVPIGAAHVAPPAEPVVATTPFVVTANAAPALPAAPPVPEEPVEPNPSEGRWAKSVTAGLAPERENPPKPASGA
jgi:Tat protein translocase TatB subunit